MRLCLLLLIAASAPAQILSPIFYQQPAAPAAINWVGNCASEASIGTTHVLTKSPAAGHTLVVIIGQYYNYAVSSVQTQAGANFTQDNQVAVAGGANRQISFYRLQSAPAGVTSVTVTLAASDYAGAFLCEATGFATSPIDVKDTTGGNGSPVWVAGTLVVGSTLNTVLALACNSNSAALPTSSSMTLVPGGSVTSSGAGIGLSLYYKTGVSGSYTPTGTGSLVGAYALGISYIP